MSQFDETTEVLVKKWEYVGCSCNDCLVCQSRLAALDCRNSAKASMEFGAKNLLKILESVAPCASAHIYAKQIVEQWKANGDWPLEES